MEFKPWIYVDCKATVWLNMTQVAPAMHYLSPYLPRWNRTNGKIYIFIWTFVLYSTFRIARKPISVVKSVLHGDCLQPEVQQLKVLSATNGTNCGWSPFDKSNYGFLFGTLDMTYLLSYSLSMLVIGPVADRVHIRLFLTMGSILSGITTMMFGMGFFWDIHSFLYYMLMQFLSGATQATGWPAVLATMGNWFGKSKRGLLMGIWYSHGNIGNVFGSLIAGAFVNKAWGWSFIAPGLVIAGMGVLTYLCLIPYPEEVGVFNAVENEHDEVYEDDDDSMNSTTNLVSRSVESMKPITFQEALQIPGVIEYSFSLFFIKLVAYTFLFWLPSYIHDTGGFDVSDSAKLSTVFDFGGISGGILSGYLSDTSSSSATVCLIFLTLAVPMLYLYYLVGMSSIILSIVMLVLVGLCIHGPFCLIVTTITADLGTNRLIRGNTRAVATVSGIINGCGSLGAALGPLLCGLFRPFGWRAIFIMLMTSLVLGILFLIPRGLKEMKTSVRSAKSARV